MRLLLTIGMLVLALSANGQHHISFSGGPGIPLSDFSNTNLDSDNTGFAKTGYQLSLDYVKNFTGFLGMRANIGFANNSFDAKKFANKLEGQDDPSDDVTYSVKDENYTVFNLMVGPNLSVQEKKLMIDISLMAGYMTVSNPGFEATVTQPGNSAKFEIKEASASSGAFAFGSGLGIGYKLNSKLNLNLKFDYLSGSPEYSSVTRTFQGPNTFEQVNNTFSATTGIASIKIGIGVNL